ncbi:MAG: thioredoxin domain-containing protein, partial [Holosporales bacterium]|nr:thioredoxin domain-containing protein [Holosporales bacterium]
MRLFLVLGIFIVLSSLTCIMPADANTVKATDELNNTPQTLKDKPVITEVSLGNKQAKNKIYVYIAPSCLHCGKFVVEDVEEFIRKNGQDCCVVIKLIPTSAKDIFIMKLIQKEAKDQDDYFKIFRNYIKRTLATINYITPTKEQIALFKGSKEDEEMIKFQVVASEFGFSNEKIVAAIPDMNG